MLDAVHTFSFFKQKTNNTKQKINKNKQKRHKKKQNKRFLKVLIFVYLFFY